MHVKVKHAPKRNFEYNGSELVDRYPNLWDFEQRYCTDCEKECGIPSMEILSCILKKLSNKKDKRDEKK